MKTRKTKASKRPVSPFRGFCGVPPSDRVKRVEGGERSFVRRWKGLTTNIAKVSYFKNSLKRFCRFLERVECVKNGMDPYWCHRGSTMLMVPNANHCSHGFFWGKNRRGLLVHLLVHLLEPK